MFQTPFSLQALLADHLASLSLSLSGDIVCRARPSVSVTVTVSVSVLAFVFLCEKSPMVALCPVSVSLWFLSMLMC